MVKANINVADRATIDVKELKLRKDSTINLADEATLLIESPTTFNGGSIVGNGAVQFNKSLVVPRQAACI